MRSDINEGAHQGGMSSARRRIGTAIIILVSVALIGAAMAKLARVPALVRQLSAMGFSQTWIMLIGIIELTSAVLFLVPRARPVGFLLVTAFLGGAIASHIQHGQSPVEPAILLAVAWTGVWLRYPLAKSDISAASQPLRQERGWARSA